MCTTWQRVSPISYPILLTWMVLAIGCSGGGSTADPTEPNPGETSPATNETQPAGSAESKPDIRNDEKALASLLDELRKEWLTQIEAEIFTRKIEEAEQRWMPKVKELNGAEVRGEATIRGMQIAPFDGSDAPPHKKLVLVTPVYPGPGFPRLYFDHSERGTVRQEFLYVPEEVDEELAGRLKPGDRIVWEGVLETVDIKENPDEPGHTKPYVKDFHRPALNLKAKVTKVYPAPDSPTQSPD